MDFPEYITIDEVKRVCNEIGIRDWTQRSETCGGPEGSGDHTGHLSAVKRSKFPSRLSSRGLEVELEHGIQYPDANVTNNHPLLTGKIVLAHLKEMLDYYLRLRCRRT